MGDRGDEIAQGIAAVLRAYGDELLQVVREMALHAAREAAMTGDVSARASLEDLADDIAALMPTLLASVEDERERCIAIVRAQPYYPDTKIGMRQQWVKDQIEAAIRSGT